MAPSKGLCEIIRVFSVADTGSEPGSGAGTRREVFMTHQSQGQIQADYDRALGALDDHKAAERRSALTHWCPKCSTLGY